MPINTQLIATGRCKRVPITAAGKKVWYVNKILPKNYNYIIRYIS